MDIAKGDDFRTAAQPAWLEMRADGFALALHVQPGARRTAVVGPHGDRLKLAVASPPADGRANAALLTFLSERLGVPKARVSIAAGAGSREKRVTVAAPLALDAVVHALAPGRGRTTGQ